MTIDANVLGSPPVVWLRKMFVAEYADRSGRIQVPALLNALGACAGFAAQAAVWHELVLPAKRNPGDFFIFCTTTSGERYLFGEALNRFLYQTGPHRLSFFSLAAGQVANASEMPDVGEIARHVAQSLGSPGFGRPRLPMHLSELPRAALTRLWPKTAPMLKAGYRPAEWPAVLGAVAYAIVNMTRAAVAPPLAVRIMLEAAVPISKLDPTTVEGSGIPAPSFENWTQRALRPENNPSIVAEVDAVMPPVPSGMGRPPIIAQPRIAFVNLAGASCAGIAEEDRATIGALFGERVQAATTLVPCDVLFLSCGFEPPDRVAGTQGNLRSLLRHSTAPMVVVASNVPAAFMTSKEFQKTLGRGDNPPVNLVLTTHRNGEHFGRFFRSLFELMWKGLSMPMAYVQLAPQGVQPPLTDIPGTICLIGAGQIGFAPPKA
jgi:hypothetical protein